MSKTLQETIREVQEKSIQLYQTQDDYDIYDIEKTVKNAVLAGVEWAMEECIELSDKIELSEPDGGTKQWIAFKHFRNTMRDKLKKLTNTDK